VLDVGSGPGKFCLVAAASAPRLSLVGVERRPHLVAIARLLAEKAVQVAFRVGDAPRVTWSECDAFYVFNSFAENRFAVEDQFDRTVELSRKLSSRPTRSSVGSVRPSSPSSSRQKGVPDMLRYLVDLADRCDGDTRRAPSLSAEPVMRNSLATIRLRFVRIEQALPATARSACGSK
jgi:hypothetical protein